MKKKILDCTLRDGGYVNNWQFSYSQVTKITKSLEKANIEIIELGYLDDKDGTINDSTLFDSVASIDKLLGNLSDKTQKVVMIDLFSFDIDKLPRRLDTSINGIRLAFRKKDLDNALIAAKKNN